MTAIFEFPLTSETLASEEIAQITGCGRKGDQIEWLTCNGWTHHKNKAGEPIVGRLYARLRLAWIRLAALAGAGGWTPDFTQVR